MAVYYSPYPSSAFTLHKKRQLNKYKKRYYKKTHNLLTGETKATKEEQSKTKANVK